MRLVFCILVIMASLGCSSSSNNSKNNIEIKPLANQSTERAKEKTSILVIAPQGINPEKDSVGFNQLVKGITEPFSESLSTQLQSKGFATFRVLDQNPKYDLGQKIVMHTKEHPATVVVVLTVEMDVENKDKRLVLRVQKANLVISEPSQVERTVKVGDVDEKLYVLSSSINGNYNGSMSDMAKEYVEEVKIK